jgi:hypothetical protein
MKPANVKTIDWYRYNTLFFLEHILGYPRFLKYFGAQQKRLYEKVDNYLTGTETTKTLEVDIVDNNLTEEEFIKQCYNPVMPKVFKGAAKDWEAVKKWNLDYFEKEHGHYQILMIDNVGLADDQQFESTTFGEYIKELRQGSRKYLKFSNVVNEHENLKTHFDLKWLRKLNKLPFGWGEDLKMFMGIGGTITPLHVGFSPVLFVQVMGQKKWTFYPPTDRMFLDARTERTSYMFSNADPYNRNNPNYPLQKYAQQYQVTLDPGDVLWFPSFTWHHVENLSTTIGIRYGRSTLGCAWKSSKMMTTLIFLATKPSALEHFITSYREKKNILTFMKSQEQLNKSPMEKINPLKSAANAEQVNHCKK